MTKRRESTHMTKKVTDDELNDLKGKLLPVLNRAIDGDFSGRIEMKPGDKFNEIYAGVQTLLDIVDEKIKILDELSPDNKHRYSITQNKHIK